MAEKKKGTKKQHFVKDRISKEQHKEGITGPTVKVEKGGTAVGCCMKR